MWPSVNEELDGEGELDNKMLDSLAGSRQGHLLGLDKDRRDVYSGTRATRQAVAVPWFPPNGLHKASRCPCLPCLLPLCCAGLTESL